MFTVSKVLILCAFVCFLLAVFGVALPVALVPLGLCLYMAALLVP